MARYEVALSTPIAFASSDDADLLGIAGQVEIEFDGQRFVWHDQRQAESVAPVVTVMVANGDDYAPERLLANRFLSALSFAIDYPVAVLTVGATGYKGEVDRPLLGQPVSLDGLIVLPAPASIRVLADPRLRTVLGLYREGRAATSPFYRLLAFFNALDAAFDGRESPRDSFVARHAQIDGTAPSGGWGAYVRETFRNAVAHAVRSEGRPVLDPDDFDDWRAFSDVAEALRKLVRQRVEERWPEGVVAMSVRSHAVAPENAIGSRDS